MQGTDGLPRESVEPGDVLASAAQENRLADVLEFDALLEPLGSQPAIRGRVSATDAGTLQQHLSDGLHIEGLSRSSGAERVGRGHQPAAPHCRHPFYEALNRLFDEHGFNDFVEGLCGKFYADKLGRTSLAPGVYFRLLLVGYFEGIGSERGIAWRAADSLALREFLGLKLSESSPDHSTISRTRRLIDVPTHEAVFEWVLKHIGASGLLRGKTIGIDATTLEANAALRSIVRRDSGQGYEEFLIELAKASVIQTPRREDLAKLDRKRTGKGSNRHEHP